MKTIRKAGYLVPLITLAMLSQDGLAQKDKESEKTSELEEILVLGSRQDNFNVALTEEFIDQRQIVDLEGMFRHEPSITVGGGLPVAQKIYVRGLEDTLLNVTLDGATQAGYLYHHQGRINIEPELIKDVVIEAGAGRATTGPGAIGGAMHFTTVDSSDMLTDGQRFGFLVKSGYQSVSDGVKNHVSLFGNITETFGVLASYTKLDTDNYEDGNGDEVANSEVDQEDAFIKFSGEIMPSHYLSLSYEDRTDNGIRFARPNMVGLFHPVYPSTAVPQRTERESVIANYGFDPVNEMVDMKVTAYYSDSVLTKKGDMFLDHWPPSPPFIFADYYNGQEHGGGVESTGLNVGNTSRFGEHNIQYGLEWRTDTAYLVNGITPGFKDEETDIIAAYVQGEFQLLDMLALHLGARYDDYDYTDNHGVNFADDALSPNVSLHIAVLPQLEISVAYAQAFKGTSSPEIWFLEFPPAGTSLSNYVGPDFSSGIATLGSVEAEEAENIEIGFRFNNGNFLASGEIFRQNIENAQTTGTTERYSYKDEVESDGYALRVGYLLGNLNVNAGVSQTKPTLNDEPLSSGDMGLGTAYGRTWNAGVDYSWTDIGLSLGWNMRLVEDLDFVQAGQDEKDGYNIHDVFVRWSAGFGLDLGFAISNLTNEFYYDQGTFYSQSAGGNVIGLPQPGRNLKATISYQF